MSLSTGKEGQTGYVQICPKKGWRTRKLANKLAFHGHLCSKVTVHWYLRFNVGASHFKRQLIPKINEKQAKNAFFLLKRGNSGPMKTGESSYLQMSVQCTSQCLEGENYRVFYRAVPASCFAPKQNVKARYYQDNNILDPFLLVMFTELVILTSWKHSGFDISTE